MAGKGAMEARARGMSERNNSGTLGVNRRKEKDTHPSHSGQCMIDGKEYWISAWVKDGRDNSRFFSLAFKPKMAQEHAGGTKNPPDQKPGRDFEDGEIPF